ncbi:1667_t:CDS:2 [Paraglomus brasilianum]|uniref:1667_t:CDS:1 n=1 Tax=Paraglomus brasilianum TaxID=144538 RepID=A0A9N8ZDP3_9GLOM|nr:1667_t:CDS:2 [Paraglomus brasilianum]
MKEGLDLDDEDVDKITEQKVSGQGFLGLTQDDLMRIGIALGPAKNIINLVKKLNGEEQGNYRYGIPAYTIIERTFEELKESQSELLKQRFKELKEFNKESWSELLKQTFDGFKESVAR